LLDIKYRSYFYSGSRINSLQLGLERNGYLRNIPYGLKPSYSTPTDCSMITDTSAPVCYNAYMDSYCGNPTTKTNYPLYDSRCRNWYADGKAKGNPQKVYFQYPRKASSGDVVVTAYSPIKENKVSSGSLKGVANILVKASELSDSVNNLKIMQNGYVFVIDAKNVTNIVLHPHLPSSCQYVRCAEGFDSDAEYHAFYSQVMLPIQQGNAVTTTFYQKNGRTWAFKYALFDYETINYALLAVVPMDDVSKVSDDVQHSIDTTVTGMSVGFAFIIAFFAVVLYYFSRELLKMIVNPLDDLRRLCKMILDDELDGNITSDASSLDMKVT
jgi:hypothetical protein